MLDQTEAAIWRRLDEYGQRLNKLEVSVSTLAANHQAEVQRHDSFRQLISEWRGEDKEHRRRIQESLDALCTAEAQRLQTEKDKAKYWKWFFSAAGLLIAIAAVSGKSEAHPAIITSNKCDKYITVEHIKCRTN